MSQSETATLAAGCFWGIEHHFLSLAGITHTSVGYIGGHTQNPSYKDICKGDTQHAEAVQLIFNPLIISFDIILSHFWQIHNPTQLNRQGLDIGSQYRSAIFTHSQKQHDTATLSLSQRQRQLSKTIVTEISKTSTFWLAEEYHQHYIQKKRGLF